MGLPQFLYPFIHQGTLMFFCILTIVAGVAVHMEVLSSAGSEFPFLKFFIGFIHFIFLCR